MRSGSSGRGVVATLLAVAALLLVPGTAAAEPALPAGFQDEVVFDGLEQPTNFRFAPGSDERVFVAEKPGRIWVFDDLEDEIPTLFADLRGSVYDNGDRGLLGLELDPDFAANGRVYALYTWDHVLGEAWDPSDPKYGTPGVSGDPSCPAQNSSGSCLVSGRLVALTEDELNPSQALEEGGLPKEEQLLEGWCQQFSSHSVGELQFGSEGALYVSGGDGAAYESIPDYGQLGTPPNPCGDPPTAKGESPESSPGKPLPNAQGGALRSQNLKLLNGAILRIDPDTGAAWPGNPLAASGDENTRRTIAKGFRNPFRFTFDSQTGGIYSGNVGSSEIEEIDRLEAPPTALYNSGWPCFEGIQRHFQFRVLGLNICEAMYASEPNSASLPFFSYSHRQTVVPDDECPTESGSAVGGISLYQGSQFPAKYKGALFFADAVRGCFWVMLPDAEGEPDPSTTERFLREGKVYPGVKISEGPGEYLYYASLFSDEGTGDGEIHRIAYRPNSPVARLEAKPPYGDYDGSGDFKTTVDASKSTDPDGDPLTYEWDLDEDGVFEISGSAKTQALTFTKAEQEDREDDDLSPNRVVTVRVDDGIFESVARVTIYPGDQPPAVTITKPTASEQWSVGDLVKVDGKGVGLKSNGTVGEITEPLPYYWVTRMAHCPDPSSPTACHVHPLETFSGIRRPEFIAPQHDYPSYIEILLRVSDSRGLSGTATLKFQPRTVNLSLASSPPGIELLAANTRALSPFAIPAIDGSEILISAPQTAVVGGKTYTFAGWSDGGGPEHPILVSSSQPAYTATYTTTADPPPPPTPPRTVPQTTLKRRPPAKTAKRKATFTFSSNVAGASFRCKLDGKPKLACRSPKAYRGLKPGRHTFKAWATSGVLTDPTPAKFTWKVLPR